MVSNVLLQDAKFDGPKTDEKALVSHKKRDYRKPKCYACKREGLIGKNCPQEGKESARIKKNLQEKTSQPVSLFSPSSFLVAKKNNVQEWFID